MGVRSRGFQVTGVGDEHLSREPPSHRTLNGRDTEVRPSGADARRRARLSISFFVVRNRDFDGKIFSNSFSKWLFKCSHPPFRVSR